MQLLQSFSEPIILFLAFSIIFAETGVLTFFFLPGDTLLLSLGLFAHQDLVSLPLALLTIAIAGFFGNILGYHIGLLLRKKRKESSLLQKVPERYIVQTEKFYEKYGAFTIVFSRFIPVVRTVAPFLAGVSCMKYRTYLLLSLIGAFLWSSVVITVGYFFGSYIPSYEIGKLALILMVAASVLTPLLLYFGRRFFKKS